jgi:hypothetical protein
MRDFKGMKRQRGRGRGGGGGGKPQQNANRAFDSNGPDGVKVRGNAQTVFEKYQQLARDASSSGDRVLAENYLQHAEHYFRLLRAIQPQRPASEILGRDQFASGYDIDFEDEGAQAQSEAADEAAAEGEGQGDGEGRWQGRDDRPRDDRPRDDRRDDRRDERQRDDRPRDRFENRDRDRDFRDRDDRNRDDRNRDRDGGRRDRWRDRDDRNRGPDRVSPDRVSQERAGQDRGGEDRNRDRFERRDDRPEREPAAAEPQPAAEERASQMLRDAEGGESHAPAFLQAPAAPRAEAAEDEGVARRPRRRRAPRSFEGGEAPAGDGGGEGEAS